VRDYLGAVCTESIAIPAQLAAFEKTLADLRSRFSGLVKGVDQDGTLDADKKKALMEAAAELGDAEKPYETDRARLLADLDSFRLQRTAATTLPPGEAPGLWETNQALHAARLKFDPIAEAIRGLIKQVDLLYKLTARVADLGSALAVAESVTDVYDRRAVGRLVRQFDEDRKVAVEQLKHVAYFHRQEIEAADWSLTPGRYVGVAPSEEDEDFDFEVTLRSIHTELADLNKEAVELAAKIQANFEELTL
jgi:type I restriction enzyme M protein